MWVINIQHWLDETMSGPAVPQLRLKVKKISEIITYATSVAAGIPTESIPRCWRRPKRNPVKVSWISYSIKHPDKFIGIAGYAEMRGLFQDGKD